VDEAQVQVDDVVAAGRLLLLHESSLSFLVPVAIGLSWAE
jgi:hypothetical protein